MRILALLLLVACTPPPQPTFKKPNNELIVGDFARKPPDGERAARFTGDRRYRFVKNKAELDKEPPLSAGKWELDKETLTLTAEKGECAGVAGTYKVVLSKIGIRWQKLEDPCEERRLDGQTWWRQ